MQEPHSVRLKESALLTIFDISPNSFSHLTYTFGDASMSQAVGSKILVVIPQFGPHSGLCASLSSSLKSCGLSPEVVSEEEAPLEREMGRDYACVVYVGSEYDVSRERV